MRLAQTRDDLHFLERMVPFQTKAKHKSGPRNTYLRLIVGLALLRMNNEMRLEGFLLWQHVVWIGEISLS